MGASIHGTVTHRDGSKATKTKVTLQGAGQQDCFTDSSGNYSIVMSSGAVTGAYVRGTKVWSGSCTGGRLDLRIG